MSRIIFGLLLIIGLVSSCKTEPREGDSLQNLLEVFNDNPDEKTRDSLTAYWRNYFESEMPEHHLQTAETIATALAAHGEFAAAIEVLRQGLINNLKEPGAAEDILQIATWYESQLGEPIQAEVIKSGFKKQFPNHSAAAAIELKDAPPLTEQIKNIGMSIFENEKQQFDKQQARRFIDAVENFALLHPKDSIAAVYLIDAATIARNLNQYEKVVNLFQWVYHFYPDQPRAGDALFLEAFTYDADLHDIEKARAKYQRFLDEYPDHPLRKDAAISLKNLGKSDEEILRELETR